MTKRVIGKGVSHCLFFCYKKRQLFHMSTSTGAVFQPVSWRCLGPNGRRKKNQSKVMPEWKKVRVPSYSDQYHFFTAVSWGLFFWECLHLGMLSRACGWNVYEWVGHWKSMCVWILYCTCILFCGEGGGVLLKAETIALFGFFVDNTRMFLPCSLYTFTDMHSSVCMFIQMKYLQWE